MLSVLDENLIGVLKGENVLLNNYRLETRHFSKAFLMIGNIEIGL